MTCLAPLGRRALLAEASSAIARQILSESTGSGHSAGTRTAYIIICISLVLASGLSSGLALGLLSLDRVDIEVIKRTGTPKQQWLASRVEPILANPHFLMVSLLLCNAAAYEALPIFLTSLLNPVAAIFISVTAILLFGEILPQAVCKRYGLHIGGYLSWPVRGVMLLTAPISWPLGKLLDWLLGEETALFRRPELRALVTLHDEADEDGGEAMLTAEEVKVIHGALDMAHKTAETAMTPLDRVTAVAADAVLDRRLITEIMASGHSRVPVYEGGDKKHIIGLLLVKDLVLVDLAEGRRVRKFRMRELDYIRADTPLYSVMEFFRLKHRHMAVITRVPPGEESAAHVMSIVATSGVAAESSERMPGSSRPAGGDGATQLSCKEVGSGGGGRHGGEAEVIGVITIEDVIEELLQHSIAESNAQVEAAAASVRLPPALSMYLSKGRKPARSSGAARTSITWHPATAVQAMQDAMVAAAAGAAYAAAMQAQVAAAGGVGGGEVAVVMGAARRAKSASVVSTTQQDNGSALLLPGRNGSAEGRANSSQ